MEEILLKNKILRAIRKLQQEKADGLKKAVDEAQQGANEYGGPKDRYDSYRTQLLRKRDMFAQQLFQALEQLDILNLLEEDKVSEKVEFGALVITNMQKLFISISLGKINIDGQDYYAISPKVPLFNSIKDGKKGDEFVFNNRKIKIKNIF